MTHSTSDVGERLGGRVRSTATDTEPSTDKPSTDTVGNPSPDDALNPHPARKPRDPRFSSGPCRKHPGWNLAALDTETLGRSHRAKAPKLRLKSAIERSARLIGLPEDWKLGIVPGSDTGAFEMALWSLLGNQPVDALVWDAFSADWANDLNVLAAEQLTTHKVEFGQLPDLQQINPDHDVVFAYNGTTSGVWVPDLDWIQTSREGLILCDATSAAFARPIDFSKLDVVTWSWQKVLGGEAAHGMLALSPRAVARLESQPAPRPLPKLFTLAKKQKLIDGIFTGATINTPSMLAVEDLHSALDWAESIGGLKALEKRTKDNFTVIDNWVNANEWIDWLATDPATRSHTSMCLTIVAPIFQSLPPEEQQSWVNTMVGWLAEEGVAFDIANYRSAPAGFRIWGGPTIDTDEFAPLTHWLDWAYKRAEALILAAQNEQETHDD